MGNSSSLYYLFSVYGDFITTGKFMYFFFLQEDGEKKIELKPGFLMEHDPNVHSISCF